MNDHDVGHDGEERDRREILDRVEGHGLEDRGVQGMGRDGAHKNGVAVGCRAGDRGRAEVAAGSGAVLDDDGLAQQLAHLLADEARDDVGRAACRERDDQRDRPARESRLRVCGG